MQQQVPSTQIGLIFVLSVLGFAVVVAIAVAIVYSVRKRKKRL